jgi:hypothetical protein
MLCPTYISALRRGKNAFFAFKAARSTVKVTNWRAVLSLYGNREAFLGKKDERVVGQIREAAKTQFCPKNADISQSKSYIFPSLLTFTSR